MWTCSLAAVCSMRGDGTLHRVASLLPALILFLCFSLYFKAAFLHSQLLWSYRNITRGWCCHDALCQTNLTSCWFVTLAPQKLVEVYLFQEMACQISGSGQLNNKMHLLASLFIWLSKARSIIFLGL